MAFQDIYNDHKQHLNLSEQAWMILEQDRAAFGEESLTGFLNYILLHYCKEADASLFRTRLQRTSALSARIIAAEIGLTGKAVPSS